MGETPETSLGKFLYRAADGSEQDVTDAVGCLYDLVINSMDWGSGFLTYEDAEPVVLIARLGGFKDAERAQKYIDDKGHADDTLAFQRANPQAIARRSTIRGLLTGGPWSALLGTGKPEDDPDYIPHNHVWSKYGRCMWAGCYAQERT